MKVQIVPAATIRSVHMAAYRHYNGIAAYNQLIKSLKLSNRFILRPSVAGLGMNVA